MGRPKKEIKKEKTIKARVTQADLDLIKKNYGSCSKFINAAINKLLGEK